MAAETAPKVINGVKIDAGDIQLLQNALNKIEAVNIQISGQYQEYLNQQGLVDKYRAEYYNCEHQFSGIGKEKKERECKADKITLWGNAEVARDTALRNYNSLKEVDLVKAKDDYNTVLKAVENKIKLQIQGQTTTTNAQIALIQANQAGELQSTKLQEQTEIRKYVIFGIVIIIIIAAGIFIYKRLS